MTTSTVLRRRGLGARLVPLIIALGALPLMAPTCSTSGEGVRVFSRRSLIIPMDVCFQYMTDGVRSTYTPAGGTGSAGACPAVDQGDVIKAYGLVYQLIRNGIAVYWVIDNNKQAVDGIDFTIQYQGGFPVFLFDWATGLEGPAPTASLPGDKHTINYRGGPFVVDGADYARAAAVLQSFRSTFGAVNVHVSNVAFSGYSKRTMAGGWSAGGRTPPKLALLDIGSSGAGAKNSEVVIQGYLTRAGLDTPGAAGTAVDGAHGEIYDRLFMADFVPTVAGDWTRTALAEKGYQILWVPHWAAPSSCSDCPPSTSCTCANKYPAATISTALRTIGAFVNNGRGDLFAECAGVGSFEGVFSGTDPSATGVNATYGSGVAFANGEDTHFETENVTGLWINKSVSAPYYHPGNFASPLMQIGDYPFIPRTGAIQNFKANDYKGTAPLDVVRLISENTSPQVSGVPSYDIFTYVPGNSTSRGTVVYLGGHSYSGTDGAFEIAGTRLVLNTLFNLGSSCQGGGVCNSGLPGVCAAGHFRCLGGPDPVCVPDVQPGQNVEICNGLDDDCDGQVDEGLQTDCYEAPPGYVDPDGRSTSEFALTRTKGVCRPGISVCQRNGDGSYGMTACAGQVLPAAESCNGLDDDCDGAVDDGLAPLACYDGPPVTTGVGECRAGAQRCQNGQWGAFDPTQVPSVFVPGLCGGEVLPRAEVCTDSGAPGGAKDDDCDGVVNNGCTCAVGTTQGCFSGPGTAGVGTCVAGTQTCTAGGGTSFWGACGGQTVGRTESCVPSDVWAANDCANYPSTTTCRLQDVNCDGAVTRCPDCNLGQTEVCPVDALPPLPPGSSWGQGQCSLGTRRCTNEGKWGTCTGFVLPATDHDGPIEYCDGRDNDCNGAIDDNAVCPVGDACLRGVCVPASCGTERPPPEGYACSPDVDPSGNHTTISGDCGALAGGCGVGQVCSYGNCIDPCPVTTALDPVTHQVITVSQVCGQGTVCGGGACLGGGCYESSCGDTPSGQKQLCLGGTCTVDPCDGKLCPGGTFCRQGDCVQACTFVTCFSGERCGQDGFCEPDPCAGKLCAPGQKCTAGICAADPCLGKGCATGQICVAQGTTPVCVDDPCAGVSCPAGACAGGQCYRSGNLTGAGTASRTTPPSPSSSGCGCGSGPGVAFPALLALLAVPLARRRRRGAQGGRGALLLVLVSVALVASACKEKKTESQFDPTSCAATCPGEERCVDITADPSHCGATVALACGHACAAGEQCVDSVCGPSSQVAPYIRTVSPSSGTKDTARLAVTLAGDRFQQGADLRLTVGSTTRSLDCGTAACGATAPCCQWLSTSSLAATLDLTGASPAVPQQLRVVNPDGVISNARALSVVIPSPTVAGVTPNAVPAGSSTVVEVSGSGFTSGSRCHLFPVPGIGDLALTTTLSGGGSQLDCVVDAATIPPAPLTLTVVSEPDGGGGTHVSNGVTLTVTPSDPVITAVDPSSAVTTATFLISGARFDLRTARVLFSRGGTTAVLDPANVTTQSDSAILVHHLAVGNATYPDGIYTVAVRNGTAGAYRTSNGVSFSVGGAQAPTLTSFTTSPAPVFQGEPAVTLTFTGAALPSAAGGNAAVIELQPPGSSTYSALATTVTCAGACTASPPNGISASATRSFVGQPEGQWSARLRFGANAGDPTSAPWPLRVLSNQAILRDYAAAPDPAQAGTSGGTKDSLSFTVSNIRGPDFAQVRVVLVDPAGVVTATLTPVPEPDAASTVLQIPGPNALSLVGRDTGTYAFKVRNPNATLSNGLPFAITAGAPVLTGACAVTGTGCLNHALQQDAPLTVRLTGINFARPDANGANGSIVMAAADFMAGFPAAEPCDAATGGTQFQAVTGTVTVVSPTTIEVQLDTRSAFVDPAFGTTYHLAVWNPGGPYGLQKSDCGRTVTSLPSIRLCATAACNQ